MAGDDKPRNPAIASISDLQPTGSAAPAADPAIATIAPPTMPAVAPRLRKLPPPMAFKLHGGEQVELTEDQVFVDRQAIRKGERGIALYPSSQAASWVVRFPRTGPMLRVIPEHLLRLVPRDH